MSQFPESIESEEILDEVMTTPREALTDSIQTLASPLLILGAGGKMGPTLAVLARRAAERARKDLEILAVSRFSDEGTRQWLEAHAVKTVHCDLLDREAVRRLPDAENIIYLVGLKFGTADNPALTWAMNTLVPAHVSERFPEARVVALSSGNIYPLAAVGSGGAIETDSTTPVGEYPNACIARERIFEYYSRRARTPVALIRLNYAVDLRYGVLLDIAQKVYAGEPINVTMGYLNCIWQGDANEFILRSLPLTSSPPAAFNLTGRLVLSVRALANEFGTLLGKTANLVGSEAATALLSNPGRLCALLGEPPMPLETMMRWTAHWVKRGGRLLHRPTHFEVRDGKY
jgi:nucleoside-diphosphate-sugar epimerase